MWSAFRTKNPTFVPNLDWFLDAPRTAKRGEDMKALLISARVMTASWTFKVDNA